VGEPPQLLRTTVLCPATVDAYMAGGLPDGRAPRFLYLVRPPGRDHKDKTKFPALSAQQPPTQGHDIDMGTTQNTAAIYVRRSAFDADNTEAKRQKAAQAEARRRG
jgi:hypothetical protein